MNIKLEVTGQDKVMAALKALGDNATKGMASALYQEGEALIAEAKLEVPVDLGTLRSSGTVLQPEIEGSKVTVKCGFGGPSAPYALYVHEGTGPAVGRAPYWPPADALRDWAHKHGFGENVYLVQRAIYMRGTQPKKYLESPAKRRANGLANRIANRLKEFGQRVSP